MLELNFGGNDSEGASTGLARHGLDAVLSPIFLGESTNGGLLLGDDGNAFEDVAGASAGGTGRVGLGGMRGDGAESRTGTDDEM